MLTQLSDTTDRSMQARVFIGVAVGMMLYVDDGGLGAGSGAQAMEGDDGSTDRSENDVLLCIVSNLLGNEEVTHIIC